MRTSPLRPLVLTSLIALVTLAFLAPLVWMASSAFRPTEEILRYLSPLQLRTLIPEQLTLQNFTNLLAGSYTRAVANSILVAACSVILGVAVCSMAAYALAAMEFRGRQVLFVVIVVTFLVPFEAIAIPLAELVRTWKLDNSYLVLILPAVGNGLAIFLIRQFFLGVPKSLREAAFIDGASQFQVYRRIYLPLSKPALVGAGLILFVFQWQAYLWPLLVISRADLQLAPIELAKTIGQFRFDVGQMFAGALILSIIPALVILPLQHQFTQSISREGIRD